MKRTFCILIIALSFPLTSCSSQEKKVEEINFKSHYKFNSEIESELKENNSSWKYQVSASDYASKGDYKSALEQWDLAMGSTDESFSQKQIDSVNSLYQQVNAIDYIIEQSKSNQVIIINEAHHNSLHRVFTKPLLQKLYDQGYTNLGLEALSYKDDLDSLQNLRQYPVQKTGYYIKDPQFGNLIREAIEIGYTLFPYETRNEEFDGKLREEDQAKNIQKIIAANPDEKFLIHCGFDHALEGIHSSWDMAMAERLKEYTRINPLTINRVAYSGKSKAEYNHPLLESFDFKEPSILLDENDKPLKFERGDAYTDIAVFHPYTTYIHNRPDYVFQNGSEKVPVSLKDIELEFPVMVLAFKHGEDITQAVPVDIMEVESKTEACTLGLRKGNYDIVVTNGEQSVHFKQNVK